MSIGAMLLSLSGGLGLFLFGMSMMSDSIEKAAGDKLRKILEMFTKNRFVGMIVGMFLTAIIQSSSATTVMVVSFVNAGLMNLYQAAGVIFGANIGTTITSQLVSINLSEIAPAFLLLGVLGVMFCKKESIIKISNIILGFGILFMGLSGMSDAMRGMRDMPELVEILASLKNPLLGTLVGFALTAVIQSSSVTVSIVLLMANQGLLELPICLFIIMGCNIGSCVTALIASLGGKREAKRAAMIHFLFNVIGTAVMYVVLLLATDAVVAAISSISGDPGRFVANAHTIIKVCQVVILFPFGTWLVKLACLLIPADQAGEEEEFSLKHIGATNVFNPATAVVEADMEIKHMATMAVDNLNRAMHALITLDDEEINKVYEVEKNINFLNHAITDYLVKINQTTLPIEDKRSIGALFHIVNDIERIGDHAENVADSALHRKETGIAFSTEAQQELKEMLDKVNKLFQYAIRRFTTGTEEYAEEVVELEETIDEMEKRLQKNHIERMTRNECTPEAGMIYSDIISGLERVADHATNIAFAINNQDYEVSRNTK